MAGPRGPAAGARGVLADARRRALARRLRPGGYHRLLSAVPPTLAESSDPTAGRDLLRAIAAGTATVTGEAFFRSLTRHLAEALDAEVVFVAELLGESPARSRVLAVTERGGVELLEGEEFDCAGTPCSLIIGEDLVSVPQGVCARFPNDSVTVRHGLDSYLAVAMRGTDGSQIGYIGVQARHRLDPDPDERAALSIFAARTAAEIERRRHEVALRAREAEVAASRVRIVEAADDERSRIGRNLHDGAQQRLVALGYMLTLAGRKVPDAPEEAGDLIEQAREQARLAGEELRELVNGLHPSGLSEHGLRHALAAVATRSPVPLRIDALPERRLPAAVEATVFYLVSEALTNALKHANANEVRAEVRLLGQTLLVAVRDDGRGGADVSGGTGLAGLTDRVAALGGTLRVESPPGEGTRLEASITLAPWRTQREPFLEFGHADDDGLGAKLIAQILSGEKTATISLAREWELEGGTPKIGQRLPVIDHLGRRHGVVEVIRIAVMLFGEVDAGTVAEHEPEGLTVEQWRERQLAYYDRCREQIATLLGEPGWRLTDSEPLVVLRFRVVEP
jgi:signal transduction histidine kinase/uncharacterized protein YhfF